MELKSKVIAGLGRISEVFKTLLWEKTKLYGISPIQIQILIFVSDHRLSLCNVSYLAKEFGLTKPTISDAVKILLRKKMLEKDYSPADNRRYNLLLSSEGKNLIDDLHDYTLPISKELENINQQELSNLFETISKLIYQLNQKAIIQVQRTCFGCKYYKGNRLDKHYCNLLKEELVSQEIRLDCSEYEEKLSS